MYLQKLNNIYTQVGMLRYIVMFLLFNPLRVEFLTTVGNQQKNFFNTLILL